MFELARYVDNELAKKGNIKPHVSLRCSCSRISLSDFPLEKFSSLSNDRVVLKDGESVTCPYCGAVQTSADGEIFLEDQKANIRPAVLCCPKCKSSDVKRVSVFQQVALYALYSPKFLSKYECKKCFFKW